MIQLEERNASIRTLRLYGYTEDLTEKSAEQISNMVKGFEKKKEKQKYADVCPYFIGVSHLGVYDWKIGCTLKRGGDVSAYEQKGWACNAALHCLMPLPGTKAGTYDKFTSCRYYAEAQRKEKGMKQKYICKCGKTFEKDGNSDTTGYRLGADYGPEHECYGCQFILPITEGYPNPRTVDHECRASKRIDYRTIADLPKSREGFHVGRIRTLDLVFAHEIWEYSRGLEGQDGAQSEMDFRSACFGSDGRYELTLYFTKTKAGVASSLAVSEKFFAGGTERPGMTAEREKEVVLLQIAASKEKAKSPAGMAAPSAAAVSNGTQSKRSIDQITVEINFYKEQTAQNIIEIGKRLIEAKQQLQHGDWIPWLKNRVDFSEISAQRFMKIAREFSNPSPVTDLPYTKLLALLQVPEADREEFIQATHLVDGQEKTVSDMSKRELEQVIKERDEAQRNERLMRERCAKAEKAADYAKELQEKNFNNYTVTLSKLKSVEGHVGALKDSRRLDIERIGELEKQIKELESRPVEVAVQQPSEAEKQKIRDEGFNDARAFYDVKLNEARRQLEEAKELARQDAGLDPDDLVIAAASFRDSMDSVFGNFQLILRVSPAKVMGSVVRECISHMKELISELEDSANLIRNASLADEEFELPPADGMEG